MPPKQKSKKRRLDEEEVKTTVDIIKQYWPEYPITVEDIRSPKKEFVLKFYTECVNNLDEKRAFVTRSNHILSSYPPGLSEEELLFMKLSSIRSLVDADFQLGDLHVFDPIRVNNHFFLTMHFLTYSDSVMDKTVQVVNSVFDMREKLLNNEEELKEIKEAKTQKQISLTLTKTENKKLKESAATIGPKYEETLQLMEESEKKCKDSVMEAAKLKSLLVIQQQDIEKLEKTGVQLRKQIVTEDEYNNIKSNLEILIKEEQNLEEIDMSNDLFEQKQYMEQLQMCLQELNHLDVSEDLFKLSEFRIQIKNELQNVEYALKTHKTWETDMEQLRTQLENEKEILQTENKQLEEALKKITETTMTEEMKLKNNYLQVLKDNLSQINELKVNLQKCEADYKRLKSGLFQKYESICKAEDKVFEQFHGFLNKVRNKMEKKD